ncbi:DUF6492 family protein [Flavihumibacter petaseus]|uniref:Glycosyltransferase n=1 Tax=Flavihumibacter petaseus NBRC 106054 TaxID=1220578 RepID=A0A0E9MTZ9_9BACT|nr:DUF6492 family protein [Flavihumibacter petaseus]GAO41044.1 hypothetical protein FPE01S_01_00560 [Flavihumibacter petaseus NBRC 106054]
MEKLLLFIKSYQPDFLRVEKLLASIGKFNTDNIPVLLSVNNDDYRYFRKRLPEAVDIIRDSDIVDCKLKDGWRYQQVIKAQVNRLNICNAYLCLDSDSEFIRPFSYADFLYDDKTPYTVMHESKAFKDTMELLGMDSADLFQSRALKATRQYFGTHGKAWDYGPSPYLWSTSVWRHFQDHFLGERKQNFEQFFREMEEKAALPSEAVIYGEYLLKTRVIDILPVEGYFKVYHYQEQYELEKDHFDLERLSKNYLGIIMQSNWDKAADAPPKPSFFDFLKRKS